MRAISFLAAALGLAVITDASSAVTEKTFRGLTVADVSAAGDDEGYDFAVVDEQVSDSEAPEFVPAHIESESGNQDSPSFLEVVGDKLKEVGDAVASGFNALVGDDNNENVNKYLNFGFIMQVRSVLAQKHNSIFRLSVLSLLLSSAL
jgi:hypothetical protein